MLFAKRCNKTSCGKVFKRLSGDSNFLFRYYRSPEAAKFSPVGQTMQVKNRHWGEGANKNGYLVTLKAKDLDMPRWGAVDPKAVSREAMEKTVLKMGITTDPETAAKIVAKVKTDGMQTWTTTKGWRPVTASDYADKDWMNDRLDRNSNYAVQIGHDDIANILVASKEVLGADFKAPSNVSKSQLKMWGISITGGGLAASIALRGAPLLGGLGSGAVAPVLLGAAIGAPAGYVASEYIKEAYDNSLRRERTNQLPIPMPPMTMEDIGDAPLPLPQPVPESKPNERPYATPKAPAVPDIGTAPQPKPGELVKPDVKPDVQAKPQTKVDNLPQPYTPDVPKGMPPQSPKNIDPRLVPPTIIGGAALGKLAADKMSKAEVAPNGVEKINKREWSKVEYNQWFESLPTKKTPTNAPHGIYELLNTGEANYQLESGKIKFWADGIEDKTVLEAKFVGNPERSPYIEDSKYPDFLRHDTDLKTRSEFERMSEILRDTDNPLTSVKVITSDERAVSYFEKLMREYNVPGEVIIIKSPEVEK